LDSRIESASVAKELIDSNLNAVLPCNTSFLNQLESTLAPKAR
jgi:hypothetical protein